MKFPVWLLLLFLLLNFGALALGSLLMEDPSTNEWYQASNKAPWTPPGWVFGAAWFTIMALFSVFMAIVVRRAEQKGPWIALYSLQWILNVSWNPVFFNYHMPLTGLVILIVLLCVLLILARKAFLLHKVSVWLLLPYALWIGIAISMDAYLWRMN